MPDISILNTLIAVVIVILVLSLIVQSLQTLVKKLLKLKSHTILALLKTSSRRSRYPLTVRRAPRPNLRNNWSRT